MGPVRTFGQLFGRVSACEEEYCVQVLVRDNNVDQALKLLKKKMHVWGEAGNFHVRPLCCND